MEKINFILFPDIDSDREFPLHDVSISHLNGIKKIILALDYENQQVKIEGWKTKTNYNVMEQLRKFRNMGVKEFLLTSVERDGVLNGPDVKLLSKIRKINNIEIIASAGIRNVDDILTLNKMGINGVIIGRALYDKKIIFNETIKKLEKDGIS